MGICQHLHPFGHIKFYHGHREFIEHLLHDLIDIIPFQLFTIDRNGRYIVFFLDLGCRMDGLFPIGTFRVHQYKKGLVELFQFLDGFLFRSYVIFPLQFTEAAVRGHHDTYG